jgi:HK97 family phage prohead protease
MPEIDQRNLPPAVLARLADNFGEDFMAARHRGFDISYRGKVLEHRATRQMELRTSDSGDPIIDGYATVYDHPYDVMGGIRSGGWSEIIARGAADKSIAELDDVFTFFDHEGLPLGRRSAGTLILDSDKLGLHSVTMPDTRSTYSMEIVTRIDRRELDAMSFAFQVVKQEWNSDYTERTITEVKLYDVSVVSFPANPATVVQLRAEPSAEPAGMPLSLALALADASRNRVA